MSVGRPAGSGTEAARGNGAQRTRAERTAAERTTAERATAEGTTAERTTAERAKAERPAAERPAAERPTAERPTAERATAERNTAERSAAERAKAERAKAERTATASAAADGAPAGRTPAERTATASAAADGAPAGRDPTAGASARRDADAAPNIVVSSPADPAAPATSATPIADGRPAAAPGAGLFARYIRDYVTGRDGQQVMILEAGCTTAGDDLGVRELRESGADIAVTLIDDDQPVTSAALGADAGPGDCLQGDLRTLPLPQRSQDIVVCPLLLQRTRNAELVLDRLVAAIRPGGLLLLHFGDRDTAAGFLDRVLPQAARRAIWHRRRLGQPGPYAAVYERLSSARGIQAYALKRELVIAERQALGGLSGTLAAPPGFLAAQKVVAWLSRGRLTDAHEELLYVLRKPEDRFARIV